MKRIIACAGIAALGAVSMQAAYAPGLSPTESSKFWSVSLGLRGFYDSNYNTQPANAPVGMSTRRGSWGMDVSPKVSLNHAMESTLLSLDYAYGMRYYADRENHEIDQSHQVNARVDHAFSENYKVDIKDSFVVAQEPDLIDPSNTALKMRADGSNFHNDAAIMFHGEFTRTLGAEIGYENNIFDYENTGANSYSAMLDRMEHLATFNLRWRALQQTVAILGYQYGVIDHTSHYLVNGVDAEYRDSRNHYFYVGADHNFTPTLTGSLRVGAEYTEYPNSDKYKVATGRDINGDTWSPYADASVTWTYMQGCTLQVGARNARSQSMYVESLDSEATSFYVSLTHQITAKLTGNLIATAQNAEFYQGNNDGKVDDYYTIGANLAYQINSFLAAEAGYSFDRLDSDVAYRSYTRNRVYLGLRASY
jgi:hypothetical protein